MGHGTLVKLHRQHRNCREVLEQSPRSYGQQEIEGVPAEVVLEERILHIRGEEDWG